MQLTGKWAYLAIAAGVVVGLLIGWFAIGWGLWPVTYYDADPFDLRPQHKVTYITMVADSYALTRNLPEAKARLDGWPQEELVSILSVQVTELTKQGKGTEAQRLTDLARDLAINLAPAPAASATAPAADEGEKGERSVWGTIVAVCGILVAVALVVAAAALGWSYWQQQQKNRSAARMPTPEMAAMEPAPAGSVQAGKAALGSYVTTYTIGEDGYEDCFPIDSSNGEFLGECGMGISEVLGDGEPSLVTAFEIWLFDKSDIRTVTKVLMSLHAFEDQTLRDRLTTKGEAQLAELGKVIWLETASLKLRAEIKEMVYGAGEGPVQSHFAKLVTDLVVFSKSGEAAES